MLKTLPPLPRNPLLLSSSERSIGALTETLHAASKRVNSDLASFLEYKDTTSIVGGVMGIKDDLEKMLSLCDAVICLSRLAAGRD